MHIKEIVSQHRRDFTAIYACEHCGHEVQGAGYDDSHFHNVVIPTRPCGSCGKTADENYKPKQTTYPDGHQV